MWFRAGVWTSDCGFLLTYEGGHSLEIDGNKVSFNSSSDAKWFAKFLTESIFQSVNEVQEFLKISSMFEYRDGLAKFTKDIETAIDKLPGLFKMFKWYKEFGEALGVYLWT